MLQTVVHYMDHLAGLLSLPKSAAVCEVFFAEYVLPVVQEACAQERGRVVAAIRPLGRIVLGGDARCDNPGHTAKDGSYTLMHTDSSGHQGTRKIVSMKLFQVSEVIIFFRSIT